MPNEAQEQINLLSQQRDRLMKSLQETQSDIRSDRIISDTFVDTDALNFAVHTALSNAMTSKSAEDHSRYERTIEQLEKRLASAEVDAPPRADAQGIAEIFSALSSLLMQLLSRRSQDSLMQAVMQVSCHPTL